MEQYYIWKAETVEECKGEGQRLKLRGELLWQESAPLPEHAGPRVGEAVEGLRQRPHLPELGHVDRVGYHVDVAGRGGGNSMGFKEIAKKLSESQIDQKVYLSIQWLDGMLHRK